MRCTMNYFDFTLRFISDLIFLIVFGEGLFYLLSKRGYPVSMLENIGLGIYLGCGIFLAVVAFHNFFLKD